MVVVENDIDEVCFVNFDFERKRFLINGWMAVGINLLELDFGLWDVNKFWPNGFLLEVLVVLLKITILFGFSQER